MARPKKEVEIVPAKIGLLPNEKKDILEEIYKEYLHLILHSTSPKEVEFLKRKMSFIKQDIENNAASN